MPGVEARVQTFLENNKKFAETWKPMGTMEQMRAISFANPDRAIILTCVDPRTVPEQFFGPGPVGPVIRTAAGRVTEGTIATILTLRSLIGAAAVFVIHHTDCGVMYLKDDEIRSDVKKRTPDAAEEVDAIPDFGLFGKEDLEKSIREDVEKLRQAKVLGGMEIRGFSMDTVSGIVTPVDC